MWNYDFDVIGTYIPPSGIFGNGYCNQLPNPTMIVSTTDMNSYSNCEYYTNDIHFLLDHPTDYAGYLTETTTFNRSVDIGASDGKAVVVGASAFSDLATIGEDLTVWSGASIDFSACTRNVSISGNFKLSGGAGNFGRIARIGGSLILTGDTRNAMLPSISVPSLRLVDCTYLPTSIANIRSTTDLTISGQSTVIYTFPTSFNVTDAVEVNMAPSTNLSVTLSAATVPRLLLTHAELISSQRFPNLVNVSDTMWIRNVTQFDWPSTRAALTVQNLWVGILDPDEKLSACASLGGLHIHVDGDLVIDGSDLTNLTFLSGVTELRSVTIRNNPSLRSLAGLESLTRVTGDVLIVDNMESINIDALGNLTFVGGTVNIYGNYKEFDSVVQPCPCAYARIFCTSYLPDFDSRLDTIRTYVSTGDAENDITLMSQALLCSKAILTSTEEEVEIVAVTVLSITNLSYSRENATWTLLALDAAIFLKTQLIGSTTSLFVPMDATSTLLDRMQVLVEAYATAEDEYSAMVASIDKLEAVTEFRQRQMERSSAMAAYIDSNLERYINERDTAIDQMVRASEESSLAAAALLEPLEVILEALEDEADYLKSGITAIKETAGELAGIGDIMKDFEKETSNTTGSQPSSNGEPSDGASRRRSLSRSSYGRTLPSRTGHRGRSIDVTTGPMRMSRYRRDLMNPYMKAAKRLGQIVGNIFQRASAAYDEWVAANAALEDFALVLEHMTRFIEYVTEMEEAITTLDSGGSISDLEDFLASGNFTTPADWIILPPSLEAAFIAGQICFSDGTVVPGLEDDCNLVMLNMEIMAIWGSQVTALAGAVSEYERAIGTSMTALNQLARYSKDLGNELADLTQMTEDAKEAARRYADQYMATLSSVALYELQQLCSSIEYFAPDHDREIGGCDVLGYYVGMSSRELQRRLSSVTYAYRTALLDRHTYRETFIPKIDVTAFLQEDGLERFLTGDMVTLTIQPGMLRSGPLATDQNAEWKYIFVDIAGIPATMGVANSPHVDLEIHLQAPFIKVERFDDGSSMNRTFTLWGVHANYAFRAKSDPAADCIASIAVPAHLADNLCQVGVTDGLFSSAHYQLPSPFATLVLRIANMPEILEYDPAFFENATGIEIGGVIISNPRYHHVGNWTLEEMPM